MDVTFCKNQPYYPKPTIQGENPTTREYQLLKDGVSTTEPQDTQSTPFITIFEPMQL